MSTEGAIKRLSELYSAGDTEDRSSIVATLADLETPASSAALVNALGDTDGDVRRMAATSSGELGLVSAAPELTKLLLDSNNEVSAAAADALGRLHQESTKPKIAALLDDRVASRRIAGLVGLVRWGDLEDIPRVLTVYWKLQEKERANEVDTALTSLAGRLRTSALVPLVRASQPQTRFFGVLALQDRDRQELSDSFLAALDGPNVNLVAMPAVGNLALANATGPLIRNLDATDGLTVTRAVSALSAIKATAAKGKLIELLEDSDDEKLRAAAARALGNLPCDEQIHGVLLRHLQHDDYDVRLAVANALASIGDSADADAVFQASLKVKYAFDSTEFLDPLARFDPSVVLELASDALRSKDRRGERVSSDRRGRHCSRSVALRAAEASKPRRRRAEPARRSSARVPRRAGAAP